ncbi:hypothetical protein [Streptantibioticus ferralitis]|uniref:Uncharacterized protein n=1 Tax=Streptantibioticus ferralitis TaxID=236510 RepID=A0ABT5Z6P0_9ACTN|nr:hypothetical protein [Streptantibioticus ferralitis]MDF2259496.1 hypothetical protein [Streptantibioticus ferralitis]
MPSHVEPLDLTVVAAPGGLAFRSAHGTHGRAALELLSGGEVLAVYVDTAFSGILVGALRGRHQGEPWALAWGRRSPDGELPAVVFEGGGPLRRRSLPVPVTAVGERFWVACAQADAVARSASLEGGGGRRVGGAVARSASVEGGGGRRVGGAVARSASVEGGGGRRVGEFRTVTAASPGRVESWRLAHRGDH